MFGERECASKIAEIDNSVKVIDQQIEHAEQEITKLTAELAADPIPEVQAPARVARSKRGIACEKTLATRARCGRGGRRGAARDRGKRACRSSRAPRRCASASPSCA